MIKSLPNQKHVISLCVLLVVFAPICYSNYPFRKPTRDVAKEVYRFIKYDTVPAFSQYGFFVSNRGSDTNDGKSAATPKLTISSMKEVIVNTVPKGAGTSLNLEESSVFREEFNPVQNDLRVNSFGSGTINRFAKISGMDIIREWIATTSYANLYQNELKHFIELASPGYSNIMVAEIDTLSEKTHPVSAVKYLAAVSNLAACNTTAGTYFTPPLTTNPVTVYIHPTEGSPGKSKYRYEVTTRNYNINGYNIDNGTYENLYLQTSGQGYGMLTAGKNSFIKNVVFQGGGTHHTVVKSGEIDSCLFLPGPKGLKDQIAAVFYSAEGKDDNNKIRNTIFLDVPSPVYVHTNGEINHKSLVLDNVYAFADTTNATYGLTANDTDSIDVNNCYVDGYAYGWWFGGGNKLDIRNSIFRNTNQSAIMPLSNPNVIGGQVTIKNVLIKTNGNDGNQNVANGWMAFGIRSPNNNLNLEVSNSIIHGSSTYHELSNAVTAFQVGGLLKAHHNIYICDVNENNSMHVSNADNSRGKGSSTNVSSDYNVYILLRGSKFHWIVNPNINNDQNLTSLSEWQNLTGQDRNSILIDLRHNPLGLKALFVDPDNGNWTLNQTPEAAAIRTLSAGMTTPPLFYPKRPAVNNYVVPFKKPGGVSSFKGIIEEESQSLVQWQTFNESDFSSFVIEYSLDGIHFMEAGTIPAINDSRNHDYQFTYSHSVTDSIYFRLKSYDKDSTAFFNSTIKLVGSFVHEFKIVVFPNPFKQNLTVEHPRREVAEVNIFDYSGRFIKTFKIVPRAARTVLSIGSLPSGRYYLQWKSGSEMLSGTVIK